MEADALLERDTLSGKVGEGPGGVGVPAGTRAHAANDGALADADIQVKLTIPSGFWIRGKGLDVELSGNLTIEQQAGRPVIAGELRAVRGTLVILGRSLQLERGTVTFFGGDEINPSLDFVLTTRVSDTEIQIFVGGTAQKPSMNFASNPEMSEADIMAVLLFGRPFNNLDEGQAGLVKERSTEMLASVGAVKLQEELGSQLGIDVLTLKSTGRGNSNLALSVGKYISPRVLLSYAYSLEDATESYVSVEYFLKGRFKLESTYRSQTGRSSLGVGWSKEYGR
jgi:translocation and assembly module TamB